MRKGFIYKMYNKNQNFTPVAQAIFNKNMERLRAGDNPLDIAKSMKEQVQLVEYNGPMEKIQELYYKGIKNYLAWKMPCLIQPKIEFPRDWSDWSTRTSLMPIVAYPINTPQSIVKVTSPA